MYSVYFFLIASSFLQLSAANIFPPLQNNTPLHTALNKSNPHIKSALVLIANPTTDINAQNMCGDTPLHLATVFKKNPEIMRALLKRKDLNLHLKNKKGNTALLVAAENGNLFCVQKLLRRDISLINASNNQKNTALLLILDNREAVPKDVRMDIIAVLMYYLEIAIRTGIA